jgi:predicted glycoside hydrolase/deacetylase ChbG (UPF0249 family)
MRRYLIFNADDFGASRGVNRGIVDCHTKGVLTSTSMMVTGRAVAEAVSLSREHPGLAVGLHWDVWGEDEREFDTRNLTAVREEFHRQMDTFERLMGRLPTHIDSHRHAHRAPHLFACFRELAGPFGLPLRDDGGVRFVGDFYAQWEWMVTEPRYISVEFLQDMIRQKAREGYTEFSCHPGYVSEDYTAVYLAERETEVATLTDPRIRETIAAEGVELISYADYSRLRKAEALPAV